MTSGTIQPPRQFNRGWGCLIMLGIFVVLIIVGVASCSGGDSDVPDDYNNSYTVKNACETQVKEKLKAPSTAKFSGENANKTDGDSTWVVTGDVDAENSFGAQLRNEFQCTVIVDGSTTRTRVDSLG